MCLQAGALWNVTVSDALRLQSNIEKILIVAIALGLELVEGSEPPHLSFLPRPVVCVVFWGALRVEVAVRLGGVSHEHAAISVCL